MWIEPLQFIFAPRHGVQVEDPSVVDASVDDTAAAAADERRGDVPVCASAVFAGVKFGHLKPLHLKPLHTHPFREPCASVLEHHRAALLVRDRAIRDPGRSAATFPHYIAMVNVPAA